MISFNEIKKNGDTIDEPLSKSALLEIFSGCDSPDALDTFSNSFFKNIDNLSALDQKEIAIKMIENGGLEHIELNLAMFNEDIRNEIEEAILKELELKCEREM